MEKPKRRGCFNCYYQNIETWDCDLLGFNSGIKSEDKLNKKGIEVFGSLCGSWKQGIDLLKVKVTFD